jgi:UDP-glucose 4-epimerase
MILLTGAGGFVGRRLYARLKASGLQVVPLYHAEVPELQDDRVAVDLIRSDHLSLLKSMALLPETVIHLAGEIQIALQPDPQYPSNTPLPGREDLVRIYMANVTTTVNVVDFCLHAGVRHLVFASSQAVYGMPETGVLTEESSCAPLEHYAASKLCCEHILRVSARQGLAVTVLRFPGVFSEERRGGSVYKYCWEATSSKRITVTAQFPLPFDVIHVDDVTDGLEKAVRFGGREWTCLNLAYGEPCSLDLLADAIADLVPGCQVDHSRVSQPVVQTDSLKAYAILGWKPKPRQMRLTSMLESVRNAA